MAKSTVNALCHVDIVARGTTRSVGTLLSLDRDGLGRADGLAQLAGDAALLTGGIATESVLATETGGDGALLEGVVDCVARRGRVD